MLTRNIQLLESFRASGRQLKRYWSSPFRRQITILVVLALSLVWFYPDIVRWAGDRWAAVAGGPVVEQSSGKWEYTHRSRTFQAAFGNRQQPDSASWQFTSQPANGTFVPHSDSQTVHVGFWQWLKERYAGKPKYSLQLSLANTSTADTTQGQLLTLFQPSLQKLAPKGTKLDLTKQWEAFQHQTATPSLTIDQDAWKQHSDQISFLNPKKDFGVLYTVVPDQGVKENVMLYQTAAMDKQCMTDALAHDPNHLFEKCPLPPNVFVFNVQADPGVQLQRSADNQWYFTDSQGRYLGHFSNLVATDSHSAQTNKLQLDVIPPKEGSDHTVQLKVTLDLAWLLDPTRVYPVQIDPSIIYSTSTDFSVGIYNRSKDSGSGANPQVESYYQELPADAHTLGLYHMNNNWNDSSGNGRNGTAAGGVTFTTSAILGSHAGTFDGVDDRSLTPLNTGKDSFTIEFWVKATTTHEIDTESTSGTTGTSGEKYVHWTIGDTSGTGASMLISVGTNGVSVYEHASSYLPPLAVFNGNLGTNWNHVAVVYDNRRPYIYLNGVLVRTGLLSPKTFVVPYSNNSGQSAEINTFGLGGGIYGYFAGQIDEYRITSYARSAAQIATDAQRRPYSTYTSGTLDLTSLVQTVGPLSWSENGVRTGDGETLFSSTSLISQWNFNGTSGTTLTNDAGSCGASCNGTLTSFASTGSQDAAPLTGWTARNKLWGAGALMFDGNNDYVAAGTSASYKIQTFTVEGWIFQRTIGSLGNAIFGTNGVFNDGITSQNYLLSVTSTQRLQFSSGTNTVSSWNTVTSNHRVPIGEWAHVAVVVDGTGQYLYINGVLDQTGSASTISYDTTNYAVLIGQNTYSGVSSNFPGTIDSLRVYGRALTAAEILSDYQVGNIQFQTRTGTTSSPNDGTWSAWAPATGETQVDSFDNNAPATGITNWVVNNPSNNQTWTKFDNSIPGVSDTTNSNGRIGLGNAGRGDSAHVYEPMVIKDGSTYRMWYSGHDGTNVRQYYATSPDGYAWTKYDNTIPSASNTSSTNGRVPLGTAGRGDSVHVYKGAVIKDGSTYKMWYSGHDGTTWRIYYATSPDALTWTKFDNTVPSNSDTTGTNGRIPLGTSGKGDSTAVYVPTVIKDGSTYKMWYTGSDGSGIQRIYYATSSDGLTWTKYDNNAAGASDTTSTNGRIPIGSTGRGDVVGILRTSVIKVGNLYKLWYSGADVSSVVRVYYATSNDGLTWRKYNNIIPEATNTSSTEGRLGLGGTGTGDLSAAYSPTILYDNGVYRMWYMGLNTNWRIYYAVMTPSPQTQSTTTVVKQEGTSAERFDFGGQGVDGSTAGLWHLDETGGSSAYIKDSTPYGNHGTPTGTSIVTGISQKARSFNGTSDKITIPATSGSLDLDSDPVTLEAWVKVNSYGASQLSVINRGTSGSNGYGMNIQTSGLLNCGSHGGSNFDGTTVLQTGRWYYVACVMNGGKAELYVNGSLEASGTISTVASTTEVIIGANWNGSAYTNFFSGSIDEVRISKTARTKEEIAEAYRLGRGLSITKAFSAADLTSTSSIPFWIASDRPGAYLNLTAGEGAQANYEADNSTAGLWHLEENSNYNGVLKFTSSLVDTAGNDYLYWKVFSDSTVLATNDTIEYDVFLLDNVPTFCGLDLNFTDATAGRSFGLVDQNGQSLYAGDLTSYAYGKWYSRKVTVPASINGKTISNFDLVDEHDISSGTAVSSCFIDNLYIKNSSGAVKTIVNTSGSPSLNTVDLRTNASSTATLATPTLNTDAFLKDSSGNGNNGYVYSTASAWASVQGKIGKGLYIDGVTSTAMIPNSSSLNINGSGNAATISGWFNATSIPASYGAVIFKGNSNTSDCGQTGCSDRQYVIYVYSGGGIYVSSTSVNNIGVTETAQASGTGFVTAGQWYYITLVIDSSNSIMRTYLNGQEIMNIAYSNTGIRSAIGDLFIGTNPGSSLPFPGIVDEVRIDNVARSPQEIRQAYEVGKRAHPIVIDFGASLDSGDLISGSGDLSFTIDATTKGFASKGSNLFPGDKVIVKENYNGTEFLAQGTVTAVTVSTGAVTVAAWDAGSTFPSGGQTGFGANATVFKWQREFFDPSGSLVGTGSGDSNNQRNAITNYSLQMNGNSGASIFIDDLRYASNYLTTPAGSTVTSTAQHYAQFRAILDSTSPNVSGWLNLAQLAYTAGPDNSLLLRHGAWFNNGQKQPFWWAQ